MVGLDKEKYRNKTWLSFFIAVKQFLGLYAVGELTKSLDYGHGPIKHA